MKNYIILLSPLLFLLQLTNAQTFSSVSNSSATTMHSSVRPSPTAHTRINTSIEGEQQLKVQMVDGDLELVLNFEKADANKLSVLIAQYLGNPDLQTKGLEEWSCEEGSYLIRLQKNEVNMSVNKKALSTGQWRSFVVFATDVLREVGCQVELKL